MIAYLDTPAGLTPDRLQGFFSGWPDPPAPEALLRILQGSPRVALAVETGAGRVVGFAAAISDGVSCAYLSHLEVLPAFRRQGIGSQLVRRLLAQLEDLYMVDLVCDPDLEPFYIRLGFKPYPAMIRRNYARQNCA